VVETKSTMRLGLGELAPSFDLPDPDGRRWSLEEIAKAPAVLVAFLCNHCPFVKHIREGFTELGRDYAARGAAVVAINSNDFTAYPDDAPPRMREAAAAAGWQFPYLVDETQEVARAWGAACTPDFFVLDAERHVRYRGQMDGSRPRNAVPVTGEDLRRALDAVLAGRPVASEQRPSVGCNIKWKPGNEPDWFGASR
jgi:peroxiredoxin